MFYVSKKKWELTTENFWLPRCVSCCKLIFASVQPIWNPSGLLFEIIYRIKLLYIASYKFIYKNSFAQFQKSISISIFFSLSEKIICVTIHGLDVSDSFALLRFVALEGLIELQRPLSELMKGKMIMIQKGLWKDDLICINSEIKYVHSMSI